MSALLLLLLSTLGRFLFTFFRFDWSWNVLLLLSFGLFLLLQSEEVSLINPDAGH